MTSMMGLTCTVSAAWIFYRSRPVLLSCKKSEAIFQDRNVPLTCGNVELRGFEPLTSCMPCLTVPSDAVAPGRVTAGQGNSVVRLGRTPSAVVRGRCHLACHWLRGASFSVHYGPSLTNEGP
jgi:hypothetical protein